MYFGGGLSIVNPSMHTLSVGSTNVTLNGVKIMTFDCNNGDGIDMSGTGLTVINSVFDTGDDDVNFAAGVGAAAEKNHPVENIWIFNNYFRHGHGAVVAGSNTAAWIQNIIAEDNVMNGIGVGLRAKTGAGIGGGARNIVFRDSAMKDVSDGDEYPFEFTSAYPSSTNDPAPDMGRFKHIFVYNVSVDSSTKSAIFVSGTGDAPHEDIHFNKVSFNNTPATSISYLKNSSFTNVSFTNVVKGAEPWAFTNTMNTSVVNDTTAPSWTSGALSAPSISKDSVSLSWNGASDNVSVTAYRLYQDSKLIATVTGSTYPYSVSGLSHNTTYTFTVQAGDAAGNWSINGPSVEVTTKKHKSSDSSNGSGGTTSPADSNEPAESSQDDGTDANLPEQSHKPAPVVAVTPGRPVFDLSDSKSVAVLKEVLTDKLKSSNAPTAFNDVSDHWAAEGIKVFSKLGVVDGYEDGSFKPDANISRGEFAAIVAKAFNIGTGTVYTGTFSDISGNWAKASIMALASNGILNGYEDGTFRADQDITRAEMVAIMSRIIDLSHVQESGSTVFRDIGDSWNKDQIEAAAEAGIINGEDEGSFAPDKSTTRAEALTVLLRSLQLSPEIAALIDSMK
ncbi:S-layer homology domain-containing protein [Paenibacillus hexagrammi]|uniref:S-layer homology domain-containing protein n=1 Tax=Paenibacillus hexagrammi TaxID=2908839 RepID=A0ABY3SF73_9BACL|nr:S-layer homology domain-containing protein [Paenibacillus sp. YPD9-1]UJF32647.1 S-layer homology domain-containing protein [Paenibacillus sp. YPD9-1]